jgi:hypothetical protein
VIAQARRLLEGAWRHRTFRAGLRPRDVFIVGYPKSGTTWLAFLLENAIQEALVGAPLASIPDVNEGYFFDARSFRAHDLRADPRVFRVHAPRDDGLPRVIYVLRDPRDVMISYWHHRRLTEAGFDQALSAFLDRDDHWPCTWEAHVRGWLLNPRPHARLITVRYEEMVADPAAALRSVLAFAGIDRDSSAITSAVEAARFDRMQTQEDRFVPRELRKRNDERFFRRGRPGAWREEVDGAVALAFEARYGAVMRALGYVPSGPA